MSRHKLAEFNIIIFTLRLALQLLILFLLGVVYFIYKFFDFFLGDRPQYISFGSTQPPPRPILDAPAVCTFLTLALFGYLIYSGCFDESARGLSLRVINSITHPGKY